MASQICIVASKVDYAVTNTSCVCVCTCVIGKEYVHMLEDNVCGGERGDVNVCKGKVCTCMCI